MSIKNEINNLCASLAGDRLLVQGAGGNASWKENDTLWIKASGRWLSQAKEKNIFVPVDLGHLNEALTQMNFGVTPRVVGATQLRPSIETMLHALMPHRIVIHLHPVDVLKYLVQINAESIINALIGDMVKWVIVPYHKPGPCLAKAVFEAIKSNAEINVVFMENHGLVVGGNDISEINSLLYLIIGALKVNPKKPNFFPQVAPNLPKGSRHLYFPLADQELNNLVFDDLLYNRLCSQWALYPDHIIFLGPNAICYDNIEHLLAANNSNSDYANIVFVKGVGIYVSDFFSEAMHIQLRCFYDILVRLNNQIGINVLSAEEISELVCWEAEKYRIKINEKINNTAV